MKKCFKCGNRVLPGTSTCPCCGNIIKNNTNSRQSYVPNSNKVNRTTTIRENGTVNNGTYKQSGASGCVGVFIFIFFVLPFVLGIIGFFSAVDYDEEYDYEPIYENVIIESEGTIDQSIVFRITNNNSVSADVFVDVNFYDKNEDVIDFNSDSIVVAPRTTQILIINSNNVDGIETYDYDYDVSIDESEDYETLPIDIEGISSNLVNGVIEVSVNNNTGEVIDILELCAVYYRNDTIITTDCVKDYYIVDNTNMFFAPSVDMYFEDYEIVLKSALKELKYYE